MDAIMDRFLEYEKIAANRENKENALHIAIENDDLEVIRLAIEEFNFEVNANSKNKTSHTDRITFMKVSVVDYLIDYDVDITKCKNYILRSYYKHADMFKYLCKHEYIRIDEKVIIEVLIYKNIDILQYIVDCFDVDLSKPVYLKYAVLSGNLPIVKFIIEHGGKVKINTLQSACNHMHTDIIGYLISEHNMYVNDTMLHMVNYHSLKMTDKSFLKYLYDHRDFDTDKSLLYVACHLGLTDIVDVLVNTYSYDIDEPDSNSIHPIEYAVYSNNYECFKYIVNELRADITPLTSYKILKGGNLDIVKELVVDDNLTNTERNYMLESAVSSNNIKVLTYLLINGFKVTSALLEYSLCNNKVSMFEYLEQYTNLNTNYYTTIFRHGCYKNIDAILYLFNKYIFSINDAMECLFSVSDSNRFLEVFCVMFEKYGMELLKPNPRNYITLYAAVANEGLIKCCEHIRKCRGY